MISSTRSSRSVTWNESLFNSSSPDSIVAKSIMLSTRLSSMLLLLSMICT